MTASQALDKCLVRLMAAAHKSAHSNIINIAAEFSMALEDERAETGSALEASQARHRELEHRLSARTQDLDDLRDMFVDMSSKKDEEISKLRKEIRRLDGILDLANEKPVMLARELSLHRGDAIHLEKKVFVLEKQLRQANTARKQAEHKLQCQIELNDVLKDENLEILQSRLRDLGLTHEVVESRADIATLQRQIAENDDELCHKNKALRRMGVFTELVENEVREAGATATAMLRGGCGSFTADQAAALEIFVDKVEEILDRPEWKRARKSVRSDEVDEEMEGDDDDLSDGGSVNVDSGDGEVDSDGEGDGDGEDGEICVGGEISEEDDMSEDRNEASLKSPSRERAAPGNGIEKQNTRPRTAVKQTEHTAVSSSSGMSMSLPLRSLKRPLPHGNDEAHGIDGDGTVQKRTKVGDGNE